MGMLPGGLRVCWRGGALGVDERQVRRAHSWLDDLAKLRGLYPSMMELALSRPGDSSGRHGLGCARGLPFRAGLWLDEPSMEGAKTWPAIEAELSAWADSLSRYCAIHTGDPLADLHDVIDHMFAGGSEDLEYLLGDISIAWHRVHNVVDADVPGPPCPDCGETTIKPQGAKGWTETYRCRACDRTWSQASWLADALDKIRRSTQLITTSQACELFPGLTRKRLDTWRSRGKLLSVGFRAGQSLWCCRDIWNLLRVSGGEVAGCGSVDANGASVSKDWL